VTGVLLFIAAVFAWRGDTRALLLFAATTGANILWAIWEVGLEPWGLLARLSLLPLLALWFAVPASTEVFLVVGARVRPEQRYVHRLSFCSTSHRDYFCSRPRRGDLVSACTSRSR